MLLDKLTRRRKAEPTPADLEAQRMQERYAAFQAYQAQPRAEWPPPAPQVLPEEPAIPDIPAGELTGEALADALGNHGAIILRGFLDDATAAALRSDIDTCMDLAVAERRGERIDGDAGGQVAWRRILTDPVTGREVGAQWRAASSFPGECSVGDSPHVADSLVGIYRDSGLADMIGGYFGEAPAVSVQKWVLRRVPSTTNSSWHQDGAFMGTDSVRSVNLWIAISDCGVDASGLDIVPKHLDRIVETGTEGAVFSWDVGQGVVDRELAGAEVLSPVFKAGDAVIFDHYLLHRTGIKEGMSKDRYAIETWFFAPSHLPEGYDGILV